MSCVDVLYRLLLLSLLYRVLEVVQPSRALPREGKGRGDFGFKFTCSLTEHQPRPDTGNNNSTHTHTKQGDSHALLVTSRSL